MAGGDNQTERTETNVGRMKVSPVVKKLIRGIKKLLNSERWQRFGFALFSTLLILGLVKIPIEPFITEIHDAQLVHSTEWSEYLAADIDMDGNSERIYVYTVIESKRLTILVYNNAGQILESFYYTHHDWTNGLVPSIIDINEDGQQDLLFISLKNDSVVFNALTLATGEKIVNDFLIGIIENPVDQLACVSRISDFFDYNIDGEKELYFSFDAGYGLKPRGYYRFEYDSLKLYTTPDSYISWLFPVFHDINRDGIPEILPGNYAPMNVHFETEYSDNHAWIAVFDLEMNYLFPPIPMPAGHGTVELSPATFADTLFFALFTNNSADADSSVVFLMDYRGNILKTQSFFKDDPAIYYQNLIIENGKNYLYINDIGQFELDANLEGLPQQRLKRQPKYKQYYNLRSWYLDADNDGVKDRLYYDNTNASIEITNGYNDTKTYLNLPFDRLLVRNVYPYLVQGVADRLMVATNSGYFFISYKKNNFYWTKYLIWFAIFIATYFVTFLIQYFQRRRMEQKWETEKQLTELQFNTIRNQLNPHFIFNALNSVGYLIEKGQKEEAYDYLSINARLIRKVLEDAEFTARSLEEEIKFVKDYLAIQEIRFKERYQTIFSIDEDANLKLLVPKMVLHTYVENSVKHGFKNIYEGGLLEIFIIALPKGVQIKVRDNGNAVKDEEHEKKNTGKGLQIMESYYRLFEKQYNCVIRASLKHLNEVQKTSSGTEVEVCIEYF